MSSWAGPEDFLLSTSLATYLDSQSCSCINGNGKYLLPNYTTQYHLEKLLVLLRDGRKLMGLLRSFDQFANVVIEGACERVIVGDLYCDITLGLYIIRGENVVLIGELGLDKEELPPHMIPVSVEEIRKLSDPSDINKVTSKAQKAEKEAKDLMGKRVEFLDFD